MSEKTRSIKIKDVTDEEASEYLLRVSAHLNEISRLELKKSNTNKILAGEIKNEEEKLEKIRVLLNEGVIMTVHNFMDKESHEIIWKDDDGNEVERTPFDEKDWEIWEKQYGSHQRPLFNEDDISGPIKLNTPALNVGDIIEGESEDINSPPDERSPFDEHDEEEVEAERDSI